MQYQDLRSRLFGLACLLILAAYAVAGLGPFHAPINLVEWRSGGHPGLHFGEYGTLLGRHLFGEGIQPQGQACSFEFWIAPALIDDWNTFAAWYDPQSRTQIAFHQMAKAFSIQEQWRGIGNDPPKHFVFVSEVFRADRPSFVTITSDAAKVSVFVDGVLRRESTEMILALRDFMNREVVFDSPRSSSSFGGDWLGLAVYNTALSPSRVQSHYQTWTQSGKPQITTEDKALALYLFDEGSGKIVHNRLGTGHDLVIPDRYTIIDKIWFQRKMPSIYGWKDIVVNVTGFMPFGFFFCGFLALGSKSSRRGLVQTVVLVVLAGFCVSGIIEFVQGVLPTRDSDLTDVVTNTAGTLLGALVYCYSPLRVTFFNLLAKLHPAFRAPSQMHEHPLRTSPNQA